MTVVIAIAHMKDDCVVLVAVICVLTAAAAVPDPYPTHPSCILCLTLRMTVTSCMGKIWNFGITFPGNCCFSILREIDNLNGYFCLFLHKFGPYSRSILHFFQFCVKSLHPPSILCLTLRVTVRSARISEQDFVVFSTKESWDLLQHFATLICW